MLKDNLVVGRHQKAVKCVTYQSQVHRWLVGYLRCTGCWSGGQVVVGGRSVGRVQSGGQVLVNRSVGQSGVQVIGWLVGWSGG